MTEPRKCPDCGAEMESLWVGGTYEDHCPMEPAHDELAALKSNLAESEARCAMLAEALGKLVQWVYRLDEKVISIRRDHACKECFPAWDEEYLVIGFQCALHKARSLSATAPAVTEWLARHDAEVLAHAVNRYWAWVKQVPRPMPDGEELFMQICAAILNTEGGHSDLYTQENP